MQLAINSVSPSPQALAKLNGVFLSCALGLRAVVPALSTSLFALGIERKLMGGQLVWVVLGALSVFFCALVAGSFPRWIDEPMCKGDDGEAGAGEVDA